MMRKFATDEEQRQFQGWATVEIRDKDKELIPMDVLEPQMDKFMRRGAPISLNHSNWMVGTVKDYSFRKNEETGKPGLYILGQVHRDFPIDDDTWKSIQDGSLDEMSIAGQFEIGEDGEATWAAPMEIALTGPAVESEAVNPAAKIEGKTSAKSKIASTGDPRKKSNIDEKVNEKKSNIDEKVDEKKAYADADARMKEDEAAKQKAESDSMNMKDEVGGVGDVNVDAEEHKAGEAPGGAAPEEAPAESYATKAEVENISTRLSKIEGVLDSIADEEEGEHSTDAAIQQKEGQKAEQASGAGASPAQGGPGTDNTGVTEVLSKMSKDMSSMKRGQEELVAKMGKFESMGVRKTAASGQGGMIESEEVLRVKAILGDV